jgi:hypothetical protein
LLAGADSPLAALRQWIDLFVDFLVTKHGLAGILQPDSSGSAALHTHLLNRLLPVAEQLLVAAVDAGEVRPDIQPYELMRGIGNLCVAPDHDPRYNPRRLIDPLLRGCHRARLSAAGIEGVDDRASAGALSEGVGAIDELIDRAGQRQVTHGVIGDGADQCGGERGRDHPKASPPKRVYRGRRVMRVSRSVVIAAIACST